jgi:hypothetical protein
MFLKLYLCGVCVHAANSLFHIKSLSIRNSVTRDRSGRATTSKEIEYYVNAIPWSILWPVVLVKRGWEFFKTEF